MNDDRRLDKIQAVAEVDLEIVVARSLEFAWGPSEYAVSRIDRGAFGRVDQREGQGLGWEINVLGSGRECIGRQLRNGNVGGHVRDDWRIVPGIDGDGGRGREARRATAVSKD